MRTLVIGAGGQVGLDLLRALRADGDEVIAADLGPRPAVGRDLGELSWHALDVRDREAVESVVAALRPERIVHLAAILSARGEADPQLTYEVNQTGTYHVLEAARRHGQPQILFTSTIAVFGPGLASPVADAVALEPTTMYGVTKAAGELLGAYYHRRYGLDFRAVRFPGLISATIPGGGSSDYALWMFVDGIRRGRYAAFCRPDTRIPLMYMPDGVRALVELARAPRAALSRCVYNIAAFSPTAERLAEVIAEALGTRPDFTFEPDPLRQAILDSWPAELDDGLARRDWGWAPRFDLPAMAADLIPRLQAMIAAGPGQFDAP